MMCINREGDAWPPSLLIQNNPSLQRVGLLFFFTIIFPILFLGNSVHIIVRFDFQLSLLLGHYP